MDKKLRILFMGTPSFALPSLEAVAASGHLLAAVVTRAPAKRGRKQILTPSPVHQWALAHNIPCFTPRVLDEETLQQLIALKTDVIITAAYGFLLPPALLASAKCGAVNLHASLLPRWRGATPIEHALIHNDAITGVTLMAMADKIDQGDILLQKKLPIKNDWHKRQLTHHLAELAGILTSDYLTLLARGAPPRPHKQQDKDATFAPRLTKDDRRLDFNQSAARILGRIRAFEQGGWCDLINEDGTPTRLQILKAHAQTHSTNEAIGSINKQHAYIVCGDGVIHPSTVKKAGGGSMAFDEFLRGWRGETIHGAL